MPRKSKTPTSTKSAFTSPIASPFQIKSFAATNVPSRALQYDTEANSPSWAHHQYRPNSAPSTNQGQDLASQRRTRVTEQSPLANEYIDAPDSSPSKRIKSSNGRRATDFIHRFRNAPAMSREERRRQKLRDHREEQRRDSKDASLAVHQQASSGHFIMASGGLGKSNASPEKRPKSSSATQRGYSPHYRHFQQTSPGGAGGFNMAGVAGPLATPDQQQLFRKKSPYLHKATSPSSSKRAKRRKSDSSLLLLNGRGVNSALTTTAPGAPQIDHQDGHELTPKKRRSIDHFRRRSTTDQSLTMSMIKNNLRDNIVTDPNIKPDYDKIKRDVKQMFSASLDTTLSPNSPPSTKNKSPKKRPRSSISYRQSTSTEVAASTTMQRGKSPVAFRRYSSPTTMTQQESPRASTSSDKLPESFTPKRSQRTTSSMEKRSTPKRTQSPSLQNISSASPTSRRPLRRHSTPERRSPSVSKRPSIEELTLARPVSQGSPAESPLTPTSHSSGQRSKSASAIRSGKRVRRRLIQGAADDLESLDGSHDALLQGDVDSEIVAARSEHAHLAAGSDLHQKQQHGALEPVAMRRRSSVESSDSRLSRQSNAPSGGEDFSNGARALLHNRSAAATAQHQGGASHQTQGLSPTPQLTPPADQKPITPMHLQENDPQFHAMLREHTSETLSYVFSNMKLKTFFKFTIEEAPIYERPKIRTKAPGKGKKGAYSDSLKDDPLLNVLQKRVEMVREKIGQM